MVEFSYITCNVNQMEANRKLNEICALSLVVICLRWMHCFHRFCIYFCPVDFITATFVGLER